MTTKLRVGPLEVQPIQSSNSDIPEMKFQPPILSETGTEEKGRTTFVPVSGSMGVCYLKGPNVSSERMKTDLHRQFSTAGRRFSISRRGRI